MAIRISVCMATYNGALYIKEQLDSILAQIGPNDELIIADDGSTDETCGIIASYSDERIVFVRNPSTLGHVQNFAKLMSLARGKYIALSDQDDVWVENRLNRMLETLEASPTFSLVVGDFAEINNAGELTGPVHAMGPSPSWMFRQLFLVFLGRVRYFGCTFMFRSDFKRYILPIPAAMDAHDVWIALNACIHGRIIHVKEVGLLHRIHGRNLTPPRRRSLPKVFRARVIYFLGISRSLFR
ncbi:glycosyltransferase family 2 protein [Herbaspirillum sp. 3R11]|nr:glycosyltransferase family 2 protein [Herbaspirillum sp. 3R-3a1]TFI06181.1 glycosyltransferase family 2 protein [Herbaspirillum sp. 3R11]TFI14206.1 glycosyltransferase family 2 protein [Herbaspirillum sp. 3R-11]TFI28853.1 glycosyltransferase family 2 protein [Herbaspirillum sp. 3C11]